MYVYIGVASLEGAVFFFDKKYYLIISKSESRFCVSAFLRFSAFLGFSVSGAGLKFLYLRFSDEL